jgi:hypothetical protein
MEGRDSSITAKCPHCGAPILWIATAKGPMMVEREEVDIVTVSGRKVYGHRPHICPGSPNGGIGTTGNPQLS